MKIHLRITRELLANARSDLTRPHAFAHERVGFTACKFGSVQNGDIVILAHSYYPVADEDYIRDSRYGALIGSEAFRKAFQLAYSNNVGLFHTHLHPHQGLPRPSRIDLRETAKFVPDFFNVRLALPHGALILSRDSLSGRVWTSAQMPPKPISHITIVGAPIETLGCRK